MIKNKIKHKRSETNKRDKRQRRLILISVCIALMAVIASVTGLNVAQPMLALDFNSSQNMVLWIINIYTLTLAALLLPLGAVGDRWGRRHMLILGLVIFGVANAASGLAPSSGLMLVARFISGIGAAMIMPITLAVITSTFPDEERSKAIGIWTAVAGGGGILGMYLSALLVDVASWRWLFALPVFLVLISLAMSHRFIPHSREKLVHRFDTVGSILSIVAIFGLVYALHEIPSHGLFASVPFTSLLMGILGTISFVWWELRQKGPLLDVRHFRERGLGSGSVTLLTVFGVQAGISIVMFPFFQAVLGWSAIQSTLAMMPMALLMMAASGLAPLLDTRIGKRLTMSAGIFLGGLGLLLMGVLVSTTGGYLAILPGMLAMGLGMGLSMTPSTEAITSALPKERQGVASALNDVTRELGTALGVASLGAIVAAGYSNAIASKLTALPSSTAETAREGIASAIVVASDTGQSSDIIIQAAKEAFIVGWQQAMLVGVAIMAALLVYVLVRGPSSTN